MKKAVESVFGKEACRDHLRDHHQETTMNKAEPLCDLRFRNQSSEQFCSVFTLGIRVGWPDRRSVRRQSRQIRWSSEEQSWLRLSDGGRLLSLSRCWSRSASISAGATSTPVEKRQLWPLPRRRFPSPVPPPTRVTLASISTRSGRSRRNIPFLLPVRSPGRSLRCHSRKARRYARAMH